LRDRSWSPAQIAAIAFGVWWIGNGVAVFLSEPSGASLATDTSVRIGSFSIAVNGWHGLFHLGTGLAGVAVCRWRTPSSWYALAMAAVYLTAAAWSLLGGATIFGVIHVDELGSVDHAIEGVAMAAAWVASVRESRPAGRQATGTEA
jgi:hypothetical protein